MQLSLNKSAAMSGASGMLSAVTGDAESMASSQLSKANAAINEAEAAAKRPPVNVLKFLPNKGEEIAMEMQGMLVKDQLEAMAEMQDTVDKIGASAASVGKGGK